MKLLHLVVDDKFVDMAIREFEAVAPGCHDWIVLGGRQPFRYVKDARVRCLGMDGFAAAAANSAGVICHIMETHHLAALAAVPADRQVVWIGWGYDYYGLINDAFPDGLLQTATRVLAARLAAPPPDIAARQPEPTVLGHARPYRRGTAAEHAALSRVDIFSPVIDVEYRLVCRHVPGFRARYLRWNYGTAEDDYTLPGLASAAGGDNLLIGNSATTTNNHLELFDHVKRNVDLGGRQVVVPLSYGDAAYRQYILQAGDALFGEAFVPLVDFMPRERYIQVLGSCGHVLMNHVRQQALGNLFISGLLGARLHLNRRSPLYHWLRTLGVPVSDVARADLRALDAADRDQQITVLQSEFGRTAQRIRTQALIDAASTPRG